MEEIRINNKGTDISFQSPHNFVIVGANGSGKSHLGAYIESSYPNKALRISAQRALTVPESVNLGDYESFWNEIQYGNSSDLRKFFKWGVKEQENTIRLINDYEITLSAVFSYQNDEEHRFYNETKDKVNRSESVDVVPERITDRIKSIWDEVFPQRQLEFETAKVKAVYNGDQYQAKYMSDGERVALYLISQCLLAPSGMMIIIDEPEIHLHRTIMTRLWDTIERFCEDKVFVYITHDLDFAASRKDAAKIWVQAYQPPHAWDLQLLPENEDIPEGLMLEVLGNRKPVLFVEGEKTSYDYQLYQHIYSDRYVVPVHNCSKVIELTKAFNNDKIRTIHHLDVKGLIDRDYLSQDEVDANARFGITALNVAEVENLYLLEPLLRVVAEHMKLDPDEVVHRVKDFIFNEFIKEQDTQLRDLCSRQIAFKIQQFSKPKGGSLQDLKDAVTSTVASVDVDKIYTQNNSLVAEIIKNRDYNKLLSVYNRKSLPARISSILGLANYPDFVLKLLKTEKRELILSELRRFMPVL